VEEMDLVVVTVGVLSDCGFSCEVEFASLRISGFDMLMYDIVGTRPPRAASCCLSSLTCGLGARRQVPHETL